MNETVAYGSANEGGVRTLSKQELFIKELEHRFTYHAPKHDQPAKYEKLRKEAYEFAILIDQLCPDSREKSLAITKLEEVVMWANASIARNE